MSNEPKLLVVDDEEVICEGCRRVFTRQGFEVEKCSDACKGLSLASQHDYSAILLDIKMPEMDGIEFLEALRKQKPGVPVVLMTGYPSVSNAASAMRLGASDYVTKPFTPEEISQAVHRLLHTEKPADKPAATEPATTTAEGLRYWHDAWYQTAAEGAVRVGAVLVRPGAKSVERITLPRIGEVVFQGLPLAAVKMADGTECMVPSPLSGVVVSVNEALAANPSRLLTSPCGQGWIAGISPTRLEDEAGNCVPRRGIVLSAKPASAEELAAKLRWAGCEVRVASDVNGLLAAAKDFESHVVFLDGPAWGGEGPALVGQVNTADPAAKVVVIASADCTMEAAYRIRRIFYYAVAPFEDNEIGEILSAAFRPQVPPPPTERRKEAPQPLNSIFITNARRTRVRLLAAPGLLRRDEGLGRLMRQKLMQRLFPLESSPDETPITPMNLLGMASKCDRLIVLLVQDAGRLPGSLVRDAKAQFVSLSGKGADKVTTLVLQPAAGDGNPLAFDAVTSDALAEHLVREMADA
jgi:CheY-like chemotaxis protein/glycine cleavage system H lipoate-binding protein